MRTVEDYEAIRRAYFLEGKSIREISRQLKHGRALVRKAITHAKPPGYHLSKPRSKPVLGPYQKRIEALLEESDQMPRKQRYTANKIYQIIKAEGYTGSAGTIHNYVSRQRKKRKRKQLYLPLEFDMGQDAQVDWGEGMVEMAGKRVKVQLFVMRLNYSRARFVIAFPFQKQEAFLAGHIQAFHFFAGVPKRITYDNLKTAVFRIMEGHNREEQQAFKGFRSFYLFESHYCTPRQAHEKGGVENDIGYVQRNFLAPMPRVDTFEELNDYLHGQCQQNLDRRIHGHKQSVRQLWGTEQKHLISLPDSDYEACRTHLVKVNPYSQVVFETNRYSVPTNIREKQLVLRAYPFRIEILAMDAIVAAHLRCFDRQQDVLEPLHYIPLLVQRPGAFEHALPVRRWRKYWPAEFDELLEGLRQRWPDGRGVREFLAIMQLHQEHSHELIHKAVAMAMELGAAHLDGVRLCLHKLQHPDSSAVELDLSNHPELVDVGTQPVNLAQYDHLLGAS
jgi:transposase